MFRQKSYGGGVDWQFVKHDGEDNILVITRFDNEIEKRSVDKSVSKACGGIEIVDETDIIDLDDLLKEENYRKIYDCVPEHSWLRENVYKKYHVAFSIIGCPVIACVPDINDIRNWTAYFGSIAILRRESERMESEIAPDILVQYWSENFCWREDKGCYEYLDELEYVPEVLFVSFCFLENPVVLYKGNMIPVVAKIYDNGTINGKSSDYDIAYNIIPKLQENGIQTVIFSNIAGKRRNLKNYNDEEVNRRRKESGDKLWIRVKEAYKHEWEDKELDLLLKELRSVQFYNKDGYLQRVDFAGKYVNIYQGERLTIGNPVNYKNILWLFGACLFYGAYVSDLNSIGSLLRKYIYDEYCIRNMSNTWMSQHIIARSCSFKSNDIVVVHAFDDEVYLKAGLNVYGLEEVYQQCPDLMNHVFDLLNHVDDFLTKRIADKIYKVLVEQNILHSKLQDMDNIITFGIKKTLEVPRALSIWLESVKKYRGECGQRTGAIVMNCNPFSLGHRYLIEKSCKLVDKLLVFVVEEDKSFFKFKDRIEMVRLGTDDLSNVTVIPSGKFIISAQTMPGYFIKDDNPDVVFEATKDLNVFTEIIAKELNIKVRFAGEEPIDSFTRQYNLAMARQLPKCGIEFIEIPRKKYKGEVISASRIRGLMGQKKYNQIRGLVMPQVYEYLEKYYF